MSARSQALVPLSAEQQAAWRAVAETEKRRHQGNSLAEYPYAGAFFRCLNGSRRISLSDLRFFMPSLTAEELRGNRSQWLYAVDVLIETQGEVCLLPLPGDAAERLFPSVRFRVRERSRHKSALVMQKYSRQQAREAEQKARAYQALVAQAEIELAFHSPETVGSWHARWSDRVAEHDLETLFWQWGERFPSLAGMERWQWQGMPFWQVIAEASMAAREGGHAVREMERWMVPNKLREAACSGVTHCAGSCLIPVLASMNWFQKWWRRGSLHRHPLCHAGLPEQGMRSVWILFLTARCAAGAKNVRLQYDGGIWRNVSTGMHHCLRMT